MGPHTASPEVNKKCFLNGLSQSRFHRRTFPGKMRKRQPFLMRLTEGELSQELSLTMKGLVKMSEIPPRSVRRSLLSQS